MKDSARSDRFHLRQMLLEYARQAQHHLRGCSRSAFDADANLHMATAHRLQIIGEAASHVSAEARQRAPELPWTQIVGMRHRLVHEYFRTSLMLVWQTATTQMQPLINAVVRVLDELEADDEPQAPKE